MPHPAVCGAWSKTEHRIQLEPGSHSESFLKNGGEHPGGAAAPILPSEGQPLGRKMKPVCQKSSRGAQNLAVPDGSITTQLCR